MKNFYSFLIVVLAIFYSQHSLSQTSTEFWFAPPEVTSGHGAAATQGLRLVMATTGVAATVTIDQPANAAFNGGAPIIIAIPANSGFIQDMTPHRADLETMPQDVVLNTGLHISSTANITCYYEVTTTNNPDIFALKGQNGLGTEFYTPFQNTWINGVYAPAPYTSFDIVATIDNTTILIYPRVPLDGGHPALASYSVVLNRGQTYSGAVTGGLGIDNPAGTAIVSDNPIAVSIKDDSVWPQPAGCRDLNGDQMVPVDIVGNDYIITQGGLTVPEYAYLVSTKNNNIITVAGVPVATLFVGETYRVNITNPSTFISCSEPTYCYHISGFGCETGGALLPPLNCAGSSQVNVVRSTTEFFGLNIVVQAGNEGNFQLNGNPALIPAAAFAVVPNTGGVWMAAQISYNTVDVPVGINNLITNSTDVFSVGLINGGAGTGTRFGYFSEFSGKIIVDAGVDLISCANDSTQLSGSVTGGATTGIWSTNGSGTFLPNNTTLNAIYAPSVGDILIGSVNLTLASTSICFPETDVMTITYTPAPVVSADVDQTVCGNNPVVNLNGSVAIATGGLWSGGAGTFAPNAAALNAAYTPTAGEIAAGTLTLTLTSTGNGTCNPEQDALLITFGPAPTANAGIDQSVCENNPDITLAGTVTIATGGIWSGGLGTFAPNNTTLNTVYTPTAAEIASGNLTLTLTTTGNGNCTPVADNILITFTPAPTVNANIDQTVCGNNPNVNLNGSVTGATGGIWSGGLGIFSPNNTTLNATYTPSAAEIAAGIVSLTLTTTGNGTCLAVADNLIITITASPTVNASIDQTVCGNNAVVTLNGSVTIATGGLWSGGLGTFAPSNTTLNATYTPTAAEITAGSVTLTLTTTGNGTCTAVADNMIITITPTPTANAGVNQSVCENNPDVTLAGTVTIATGGIWSGGAGTFTPNNTTLNTVYTPTAAEIAAGSMTLTLTTTGNGLCNAVADNILITFTPAPTVNANIDQTVCGNNPNVNLNGSVTGATGGSWSGGLGIFTPNNTTLNATYTPSAAEIAAGSMTLTLTTTGNGTCLAVADNMVITITSSPTVNANVDQTVCGNNANVTLNGAITVATGGLWSGGLGTFAPSNTTLNATYTPTAAEITAGSVTLTLTTTGNGTCTAVADNMVITITPTPTANAGVNQSICENNPDVTLAGTVTIATGGIWSGGAGTFTPNNTTLNTVYTPTAAEIATGTLTLTLTTTGNGNCTPVADNILITFTPAPTVNANIDQTVCGNNPNINLNGSVTGATGGIWSGGLGIFSPNNTTLNATYTPTAAEIAAGIVSLTLTTTGNGTCLAVADNLIITITASPTVNASIDQTVCGNNAVVTLNGSVTIATGGLWSGGLGTFAPSNTTLNATYTPTAAEITAGSVTLTLTTTGNGTCTAVADNMVITITPAPTVNSGINQTLCANNPDATLAGIVAGATGGIWSGGTGTFNPSSTALNAIYTPSAAEIASGNVILTLTSTGNGLCNAVADNIQLTFTLPPTANAGVDQTLCANNSNINLNGSVTVATSGQWTGGLGIFTPNNNTLNAVYSPTAGEIASGSMTLTLTTTGNGNCNAVLDNMIITFTTAPTVNADVDQTVCANNPTVTLNGSLTIATGGVWTGGTGTFIPSNSALNADYTPSAAEITAGSVTLYLTTTGNGNCLPEIDSMMITITPLPTVNAGSDLTSCSNNPMVTLSGIITGATGGVWSGGTGVFTPGSTAMGATYTPSATEITAGTVTLTLTSTGNGNCNAVTDNMTITITPPPTADAGTDQSVCANNPTVNLNGSVNLAAGGQWSGGLGVFTPNNNALNAVYNPSAGEIASGTLVLTLTTTGNGNCNPEADQMTITFTPAPTVSAGLDQSVCTNNPDVTLNGAIGIATGAQWSGGLGSFSPNSTTLNATYTPTAVEISAGTVLLYLTTTGNGNCLSKTDSMVITITPAPTVNAGVDQTICVSNLNVNLNGLVTGSTTTGAWTTNGTGVFIPSNTTLNAVYQASPADSANGSVTLILSSTNNGNCNTEIDSMTISILSAGGSIAGADQTVCANNLNVSLSGAVTGNSSGGVWSSSGTGIFLPNATSLSSTYLPSPADILSGTVILTLTANSCNSATDNLMVTITPAPIVNAGNDTTVCVSNLNVPLNGIVSGASNTGIWSTNGTGIFIPNNTTLNATYAASAADSTNQGVTLILTATGIGSCLPVSDTMNISLFPTGIANAGVDQTVCSNNANISLNGTITGGAISGQWTTTGSGNFIPSDTTLNATYIPSNADTAAGTVTLILTATNSCSLAADFMVLTINPAPVVVAGPDQSICGTIPIVNLNGSVTGSTTTGIWTTSGTGTFGNTTNMITAYTASSADTAAGSVTIYLTSTSNGLCNPVIDSLIVSISTGIAVNTGPDQFVCATSSQTQLLGAVYNGSTTGQWSTLGSGTFFPHDSLMTAIYQFSSADSAAGTVTLILTSTNNGSCAAASDTMVITFGNTAFAFAGADQSICADNLIAGLNGFVSGGSSTGIWTSSGSGIFTPTDTNLTTSYMPSANDSLTGSVNLYLTTTNNSGGCSSGVDTIEINIDYVPIVNAGSDQNICNVSDSVLLNGNIQLASSGNWITLGSGAFFPNSSTLSAIYQLSPSDIISGSVTLVLISGSNGSCLPQSDTMMINITPLPSVNAGTDQNICETNLIASLNGVVSGGTSTGIWSSSGSGIFSPSNTDLNASYTASPADSTFGSVQLVLTSTNNGGCSAVADTLVLTIDRSPIANAGVNQIICNTIDSVYLNGSTQFATGGIWTSNGTGIFVPNNTVMNAVYIMSATDISNGNVQITLTTTSTGSCSDTSDIMTITVNNPLIVDFNMIGQCVDNPVNFYDSTTVLSGSIASWYWVFGDGATSILQNPVHTYTISGNYTVTFVVTSPIGCVDSISKSITINVLPVADFSFGTPPYLIDEVININDLSSGATTWNWDLGDGIGTSSTQNPSYTYASTGSYTVSLSVTNTAGCTDSISREIIIDEDIITIHPPQLPTAFTPNGDGSNDILFVRGGPFNWVVFKIYNEWGEMIFSSDDESIGWDGTHKGQNVPVGVYVYKAKGVTIDGNEYERSGKIALIR